MRVRRRTSSPTVVCSIGSTDPTAGAGLFLDAAVYARIGRIRPVYVVAAVTAQNSRRVAGVDALSARAIRSQLDTVIEQVKPDAFRVGLLPSRTARLAVASRLLKMRRRPLVVIDPVMRASTGATLQSRDSIGGWQLLLGAADVVTPNAHEAAVLAAMRVDTVDDAEIAGLRIARRYGCAVLVTGGHLRSGDRVVDVLATPDGAVRRFSAARLALDARGTGCMLAASLTVALARGRRLGDAVRYARRFVRASLAASRPLGRGRRQFDAAGVSGATV